MELVFAVGEQEILAALLGSHGSAVREKVVERLANLACLAGIHKRRAENGGLMARSGCAAVLRSRVMNLSGETSAGTLETPRSASRGALAACTIALVVSVALNVLLAHKVRSLTDARSARIAEQQLKVGTTAPPITAKRLDGQEETISYEQVKQTTVLYIFTPPCTWCARNMDNLKTLLDKETDHYRFIGLSLSADALPEYVAKNDLKLPVYSGLSPETLKTYKLGGTPQTIVISPEGKVLQDWVGAWVGDQQKQVEAYFHVTLPGLRELPKAEAGAAARN
jgi:peroxiredoxin